MKDYSEWEPIYDYNNESPYLENPNRPWLKYRPSNVPKSIKFDPIPVHELIKLSAQKFSNNVCVHNKSDGKKYTYRELGYITDKIANALIQMGVKKGDCIGIMTPNCPEFIFCCIGIMETGAIVVPINPLLKENDVAHIIKESRNMRTIFVHKGNLRTIKKAQKDIIENIILLESNISKEGTITLEDFIEDITPIQPEIDLDPSNDIAALLFTGGTTGLPKGVMLTHTNLVSCTLSTLLMRGEPEEGEERFGKTVNLSLLPLCHSFGFLVMIAAVFGAAMLITFPSFNASDVLEAIEYFKVDNLVAVPVMYQMLINHPDFTERDLSSLETAHSGSAALPQELNKKWEEILRFKVGQGFGLTETSPVTHAAAKWMPEIRSNSIGVPIIDTDAKIVNPDTLEELDTGELGELVIRGPQIMKGYWYNPEETKKTIVDGWLRTGDLARMDEQGYFYIEGRSKDIIKYKGYKVMPYEVEEKLYEHPAIHEVGVVSAPDQNIGETIKAYVVLKPEYKDGKITEREIIEWAKERLAAYKYPRQVEFINVLPRTAVGKIFRRKLRERTMKS
ncbi:MAG: long-chain fatty acid--CoA ligase [Candidatus Lokiarchaeota archaeon]|nr:long-chain fatty acid--CoA ligase [Candidatus Lokiarchaeota archaeon]